MSDFGPRPGAALPGRAARSRRVAVLRVLAVSLMVTLICRLGYVQLLQADKPRQTADDRYNASIAALAPRGQIVDDRGRVLVGNTVTQAVTVDRSKVDAQPDGGVAVLGALGQLLGADPDQLRKQITPCGVDVPTPCWTGQPYQPVTVATDVDDAVVLAISERREQFPGVAVSPVTQRTYPSGSLAAQEMGYVAAVSGADIAANPTLTDEDSIGANGLEQQYDAVLRGQNGQQQVLLDPRGDIAEYGPVIPARAGDTLITSLDASVQTLAEQALSRQIDASRRSGYAATGGAIVVMDPQTGRIIALASYPTFDLTLFSGGISTADYARLTAAGNGDPLLSRAVAGQYAPGSTFKLVSASADVMSGAATLGGKYACPGSMNVGGIVKTNFDSEGYSYPLTLQQALAVSCDTWFYSFAAQDWSADQQRADDGQPPVEGLQQMAREFGFASAPNVDLPADEQAAGSIAGRESRQQNWEANKQEYCDEAASGYPDEPDPTKRAYLVQLASENCTDGWRYRMSDNADLAIGQGETTVSPLQLAVAYSALVNGGTIWNPTIGWAVADSAGKIVQTIDPTAKNKVPVSDEVLSYIRDSLTFANAHAVSGAMAFDGSPIKPLVAGKTGTAEVYGKQDTSWLASWAPGDGSGPAKFVVVGMIEQAGTGSSAAAPMVRTVLEGVYGVDQPAALPGSSPVTTLPTIAPADGADQPGASSQPAAPGSSGGSGEPPPATASATPTATPSRRRGRTRRRRPRAAATPRRRR